MSNESPTDCPACGREVEEAEAAYICYGNDGEGRCGWFIKKSDWSPDVHERIKELRR